MIENAKPPIGEETKNQAMPSWISVFATPDVPCGEFSVYRKIMNNPTVALARVISNAPLQLAGWTVEGEEGINENVVKFIDDQIKGLWGGLLYNILFGKDFGFQPFEKVWEVKIIDGSPHYILKKLKPLLVDSCVLNFDEFGNFAGMVANDVKLNIEKSFKYTYNEEPGNPYGKSKHENVRESSWWPWVQASKKLLMYIGKVAGVLPIIKYPPGFSYDATGAKKENFEVAKAILDSLGSGKGIAMPQELAKWAVELARNRIDPEQFATWQISFLESQGQHADGFVNIIKHYESLMFRGELVPERVASEGQFGTKAESETQAELIFQIADLEFADILRHINWYIVNPLLTYNFGPEMENKVRLQKAGLDIVTKNFLRRVVEGVLINPANIDLFQTWLDVDSIIKLSGLPKHSDDVGQVDQDGIDRRKAEKDESWNEMTDEQKAALSAILPTVKNND